jgi:hypothetical protein
MHIINTLHLSRIQSSWIRERWESDKPAWYAMAWIPALRRSPATLSHSFLVTEKSWWKIRVWNFESEFVGWFDGAANAGQFLNCSHFIEARLLSYKFLNSISLPSKHGRIFRGGVGTCAPPLRLLCTSPEKSSTSPWENFNDRSKHSRTQSPSYARCDEGLWPNP